MITMLNRMCWNSRNWQFPTGTSNDGGYTAEMGFGHEEWNFQTEDEVDGHIYGYLYYQPSVRSVQKANGSFRIFFWSKHPETRQDFVVGSYDDARLISVQEYDQLDKVFTSNRIYERRATELNAAVPSMSYEDALQEVMAAVRSRYLKFKCPTEKVRIFADQIPLEAFIPNRKYSPRFRSPTFIELNDIASQTTTINSLQRTRRKSLSALAEDAYYRETAASLKRILPRHNTLSNRFSNWLKAMGYENVVQEENFVDITFSKGEKQYRAELKTCYGVTTTKAIREALGQILEYNYYPGRFTVDYWVLILDEMPTDEDISYLSTIAKKHAFPLSIGWPTTHGFTFDNELQLQ
jgi:hypothetical protein